MTSYGTGLCKGLGIIAFGLAGAGFFTQAGDAGR